MHRSGKAEEHSSKRSKQFAVLAAASAIVACMLSCYQLMENFRSKSHATVQGSNSRSRITQGTMHTEIQMIPTADINKVAAAEPHGQPPSSMPTPSACPAVASQQLPPNRVLVTGAAGFIGFHTAKALSAQPATFILGLDNFNSALYSAELKRQRQALLLSCCKVVVIHGDIRNSSLLRQLFGCYKFTQVVHLAAQAGVRLSVQQPAQYIANNIEGTVHLLEAIRQKHPPASLVYASSSSVYGLPAAAAACRCGEACTSSSNASDSSSSSSSGCKSVDHHSGQSRSLLPSKECYVQCGQPTSVYAASKRATEEAVAVYNHQYGIAAVGLRFFTVYGPYRRPDMAVARFAASLAHGKPIIITCFKPPAAAAAAVTHRSHQQQQSLLRHKHAGLHAAGLALPGTPEAAKLQETSRCQLHLQDSSLSQLSLQETRLTPAAGCMPAVRDFTAVSDVVQGILAACNATSTNAAHAANARQIQDTAKHVVYNLGRGQPASTVDLLRHLEVLLNKQAVSVSVVMPAAAVGAAAIERGTADVWATWADMTAAQQGLRFEPRVGWRHGLEEFVAWYKSSACTERGQCKKTLE